MKAWQPRSSGVEAIIILLHHLQAICLSAITVNLQVILLMSPLLFFLCFILHQQGSPVVVA